MMKKLYTSLKILLFIYPFLPWLKEWNNTVFNILEIILILIVFISSLIVTITTDKIKKHISKIFIISFLLVNILAIYSFISKDNIYDVISGLRVYLLYIILFYAMCIVVINKSKLDIYGLLKCFIAGGIILSIVGIMQIFFPRIIMNMHSIEMRQFLVEKTNFMPLSIYNRILSLMIDPNIYGVYMVLIYVLLIDLNEKKLINKKYYLILSFMFIINIIFTNSRQAILILIIEFIFKISCKLFKNNWFVKFNNLSRYFPIVFLCIIILIINSNFIFVKFLRIDTFTNLNGRVDNIKIIMENMTSNNTLGFLMGNGISISRNEVFENSYILVIKQFGLIMALLLFSIIIYLNYYVTIRFLGKNENRILMIILISLAFVAGDYILIPQIGITIVCGMFLSDIYEI